MNKQTTIFRTMISVIIVILLVIIIRLFAFEIYKVKSYSMESTLQSGDIILVNKLSFVTRSTMPSKRIPNIRNIVHGDIAIFEHPKNSNILIKRCIGLPGDTLMVKHNYLFINGLVLKEPESVRYSYKIKTHFKDLPIDSLINNGLTKKDLLWRENFIIHVSISKSEADILQKCDFVDTLLIDDYPVNSAGPPLLGSPNFRFTRENFGPIIIPQKNKTIKLDTCNIAFYKETIERIENNTIQIKRGKILINGLEVSHYTFKNDYFFFIGDNRYHSTDSRYWGFVPKSNLIGKTNLIIYSVDSDKRGLNRLRTLKLFKIIQ